MEEITCPVCASDLSTGHGHSMACHERGGEVRAQLRGGWTDDEIAARKAAGIGGGAKRSKADG